MAPGNPPRRAAPSGGALYPVESYLLAFTVERMSPGIYHYATLDHELERVGALQGVEDLYPSLWPGLHGIRPAAAIVLSAVFERTQLKYRERGYRFALLEAGHIAQNLSLVTTALGLGGVCIGGFGDDLVNALLHLDGEREAVIYIVLVGKTDRSLHSTRTGEETEMGSKSTGQSLDAIVGRAIRDEAFRNRLLSDPEKAVAEYNLTPEELAEFRKLDKAGAKQFFESLASHSEKGRLAQHLPPWSSAKTCYQGG